MGAIDRVKGFFKKRSKLRAIIHDETANVYQKDVVYSNNVFMISINGEKHAYVVDHNFVSYDQKTKIPISYYYISNPQPIRIQHERNQEVDSIGFRKILESKVITDLFSDEARNTLFLLVVLIIISMLLSAACFAAQMGWIHKPAGG